ncbi:MAG TPA: DUF2461 domain-containing protein [Gemmatimonadota bacterium]|nr:DUF2461 domain-containing protein [Gemmatimonadota bacterium]
MNARVRNASTRPFFTDELFAFLRDLARNNDRTWFAENRDRYEREVRGPALQFVAALAPHLRTISPHFRADPRPAGGSLFRIHRDVRFSKDKSPYKTHVGIRFPHRAGKDVHAPGFYLHLEPGEVFMGCGVWHPDGETLSRIRASIAARPDRWRRVRDGKRFRRGFRLGGDSLRRAPAGYDTDHPLIEDLKRKDYIAVAELDEKAVQRSDFVGVFAAMCRDAEPFQRFLCDALGLEM